MMFWTLVGIRDFAVLNPDWLWITASFLFPWTWSGQDLRLNFPWLNFVVVPGLHSSHITWFKKEQFNIYCSKRQYVGL